MKTLDEVIKAWSICFSDNSRSNCTGCPYADDDGEAACFNHDREDALHYLKVLKDILDPLKVKKISHEITCPQCNSVIAILLPESNEPLTWDELKQMEGKPVWIEVLDDNGDHYKWRGDGWYIVKDFAQGYYGMYCHLEPSWRTWTESTYGDLWQAYRKERE